MATEVDKRGSMGAVPRARRRWWRIVVAVVAALALALFLYVMIRSPRDYKGELARLLPARTSGYLALHDFDGIRERIGQTRLYEQLAASVDLAALLMTSDDWREYQRDKDSATWKAKAALAREFLRRYFSREVVVALAWLDRCDEPALLVLARTELGFVEKLGELCAELYPELRLSTERYRGIRLYAYESSRSKRSFTFVRFGRTVVLSLWSNERDYLRRIIDYRLDAPAETLFDREDFQQAWRSPARQQGLLAVARPNALLDDLNARPEFSFEKHFPEPRQARLRRGLSPPYGGFRAIEAGLTVSEGIEMRIVLRRDEAASPSLPLTGTHKPLTLLGTVPSDCLAFSAFRFGSPAETLAAVLNIYREFSGEADDSPRSLVESVQRLNAQWGLDINRDLAPALGREAALVVHDVQLPLIIVGSLVLPVTDRERCESALRRLAETCANLHAAETRPPQLLETFRETPEFRPLYLTPLGFLGVGRLNGYCTWGFSPASYLAMRAMVDGDGTAITSSTVFQSLGLPVGEPLDVVAFVNLEEVGQRAEGLLAVLSLVSKSVRKRSAKYGKIVAVAKLLRGVGCYVRHTEQDYTVVLRVPTD